MSRHTTKRKQTPIEFVVFLISSPSGSDKAPGTAALWWFQTGGGGRGEGGGEIGVSVPTESVAASVHSFRR